MALHTVDSSTMAELISELNKITAFGNDLIADIEAIKETVSAEWTGEANAQYQTLHAEWADGANKMADGASKITNRATISSQNYDGVTDHVKGLWS